MAIIPNVEPEKDQVRKEVEREGGKFIEEETDRDYFEGGEPHSLEA